MEHNDIGILLDVNSGSNLEDIEAFPLLALLPLRLEELGSVLGQLRLERPQVVLGRLVLLSARDLALDLLDLLEDTHGVISLFL